MKHTTTTGHASMYRRRPQGGFTLVELLVVIVILGILSAVVVFAVRGADNKGRDAAVATDARTIRTALEVYCLRNGTYPQAQNGKDAMQILVDGNYLSDRSTYWSLATDDGLTQGNCPGLVKKYELTPDNPR